MDFRLREIVDVAGRWVLEALREWFTSIEDSPTGHVFTLLLGAFLALLVLY